MKQYPEIKKRWALANIEKKRRQAREYARRQLEKDPEAYRLRANAISKKSREKNIEKVRERNREALRVRRLKDPETYNLKQREYRLNNKEKFKQYYEKRKDQQKVYSRIVWLKKQYNLTPEIYEKMLSEQEGKCAICGCPFENEKPNVDHNHETGIVRSLLCSPCNIVLGHLEKIQRKVPRIQEKFAEYLKIHSNQM